MEKRLHRYDSAEPVRAAAAADKVPAGPVREPRGTKALRDALSPVSEVAGALEKSAKRGEELTTKATPSASEAIFKPRVKPPLSWSLPALKPSAVKKPAAPKLGTETLVVEPGAEKITYTEKKDGMRTKAVADTEASAPEAIADGPSDASAAEPTGADASDSHPNPFEKKPRNPDEVKGAADAGDDEEEDDLESSGEPDMDTSKPPNYNRERTA